MRRESMASPEFAHWHLTLQAIIDGESLDHLTDADARRRHFNAGYTPREAIKEVSKTAAQGAG
jgi:hypothetical protein